MSPRGRLIVLEGGEGTGKSTQAERLARHLGAELTREPGGSELGETIRDIVLNGVGGAVSPRSELLLVAAARAQHVIERIGPALSSGRDVVCDRFVGSTVAYQGYGRGLPIEDVLVASALATDGLEADLNVLLDLDPAVAMVRRTDGRDRIESEDADFHRRVFAGFRTLAESDPGRWVRVDASGSIEQVGASVLEAVEARLGKTASAEGHNR